MTLTVSTTSLEDVTVIATRAMSEVFHTGGTPSGFYDTLQVNGVVVDVAASSGWGVQLVANGPAGRMRETRLIPADLTSVGDILDALAALVAS